MTPQEGSSSLPEIVLSLSVKWYKLVQSEAVIAVDALGSFGAI